MFCKGKKEKKRKGVLPALIVVFPGGEGGGEEKATPSIFIGLGGGGKRRGVVCPPACGRVGKKRGKGAPRPWSEGERGEGAVSII